MSGKKCKSKVVAKLKKRAKRIRGEMAYLNGVARRCMGNDWRYDRHSESFVRAA